MARTGDVGRGTPRHRYTCPSCGREVVVTAAYAARQRRPCRPCIRVANGWSCTACGSADPEHPSPCPLAS
jgi:hypothetical protein